MAWRAASHNSERALLLAPTKEPGDVRTSIQVIVEVEIERPPPVVWSSIAVFLRLVGLLAWLSRFERSRVQGDFPAVTNDGGAIGTAGASDATLFEDQGVLESSPSSRASRLIQPLDATDTSMPVTRLQPGIPASIQP